MRKSNFLAAMLIGTAIFTSCSNDDNGVTSNGAVHFTTSINNPASANGISTRAAGSVWASGDALGIFMVDNSTTTIAESMENKQYSTTGDGNFSPSTGNEIYYPMNGSAVDFIAYYPFTAGKTITDVLSVDVSGAQTSASQAGIDLLWAKAANGGTGYNKTSGTVALSFDHKLAKMVMNIKADASVGTTNLSSMTVNINGLNTQTDLNLVDGTVAAAATVAAIAPRKITTAATYHASYDAIILPGSYAANAVTIVFTVNGEPYTWKLTAADAAFVSGNEYTYEVTLTRTGVIVIGTIKPWTTTNRGSVTAD